MLVSETPRERVRRIIFGHDTPAGRAFDVGLIIAIVLSVVVVCVDSVARYHREAGDFLVAAEWFFTILFTIEYIARIWSAGRRRAYVFSFFGIVDLLAILPTWLSLVVPGTQFLATIRVLRVLRIFRVLKLVQFVGGAEVLARALRASIHKITVFLFVVLTIVVIVGSMMYLIEGPEAGFVNIPTGIYWAIVTLTTVGFGDITPITTLGKALASVLMIMGYGIIAVPTGIVTVEMSRLQPTLRSLRCGSCGLADHQVDAVYCRGCGAEI
ncbi:MAG: ion transporter [Acidobacteria bacterium]|nr:ion transporter [Acidobacteriota bacterium]